MSHGEADRDVFVPPPAAVGRPTIGEFYDQDERRRGDDLGLGDEWSTAEDPGCRQVVFWVPGTGELVAMRAPSPRPYARVRRVAIPHYAGPTPESALTVEVLGVMTADEARELAGSYREIMAETGSLDILRAAIKRDDH